MLDKNDIPRHVAIIMDGNGRWAKERNLPRVAGHRRGIDRVKEIVTAAAELGIEVLTLFAFSTENWKRPKREIDMLMRYLDIFLGREVKELQKNNIKLKVIGRDKPLPAKVIARLKDAQDKTRNNNRMTLVLAINYGARQEILDAVKKFAGDVARQKKMPQELDMGEFSNYLYTAGLPDPDLLIRTSGAMRLSNFLLWQLSYAELYFPEKYWPDFRKKDLEEALMAYQARERRFGASDDDKKDS